MTRAPRLASGAALACAALALAAFAHAAPVPERVSFPSLDRDAAGDPVAIPALYFRPPQTAPGAAVPLVVAAHGCGGLFSANAQRRDQLTARFATWTEQLLADGYAVLWPDSFNARGRRSVCLVGRGEPTISPATRRLDLAGALAYAAAAPGVDRSRIALVGWSHGGSAALAAANGRDAQLAAFLAAPGAPPPFRAAVGAGAARRRCGTSRPTAGRWRRTVQCRQGPAAPGRRGARAWPPRGG